MIGWDGYEPEAREACKRGAAASSISIAPAHNLESLAALEPYLAKL